MNVDHLLKQTCTLSTAGAVNMFGKKVEGTGTSVSCRFQKTHKVIATTQKERDSVDGIVWLSKSVTVNVDDLITFESTHYRVLRVEPIVDRSGTVRHYEVMVQDWNTA